MTKIKKLSIALLASIGILTYMGSMFASVAPLTTLAQCGPGGCGGGSSTASAAGGLGGGSQMFMMMFQMLMQLLQGLGQGGSTPQQGTPDEQVPQYGTVGPQGTGPRNGYNNSSYNPYNDPYNLSNGNNSYNNYYPTPSPAVLGEKSLFLAGEGENMTLNPTSVSITTGQSVNFFNATTSSQVVKINGTNGTTNSGQATVPAGSSHVFKFNTAGTYNVCTVSGSAETCRSTVTVTP